MVGTHDWGPSTTHLGMAMGGFLDGIREHEGHPLVFGIDFNVGPIRLIQHFPEHISSCCASSPLLWLMPLGRATSGNRCRPHRINFLFESLTIKVLGELINKHIIMICIHSSAERWLLVKWMRSAEVPVGPCGMTSLAAALFHCRGCIRFDPKANRAFR
jgi:hypothetical protein